MGIAPWAPLGQGRFKTKEARSKEHEGASRSSESSEIEIKISEVLEKVAEKRQATLHGVVSDRKLLCTRYTSHNNIYLQALAYVMHKAPNVFPIVGQRSVGHLKANVEALRIRLTEEDLDEIDAAVPFDPGFPNSMLFRGNWNITKNTASDVFLTPLTAHIDSLPKQAPIAPRTDV